MRRFLTACFALVSIAATPACAAEAIGSVYSGGAYRTDGVTVRGNATLFEGTTVEIGEATARIHLANGVGMWLAPRSRATMSARGVHLLAGMGQFEAPPEYRLEARAVRIASSQPHTTVRVALDETGGAVVAPLTGAVQVTNSKGTRVGELVTGSAVRFADRSGMPATVNVSGCLSIDRDHFTLTDAITNAPVQLAGRGLEREVGHVVDISGVEGSPTGDMANVTVAAMRRVSAGQCTAPSRSTRSAGLLAVARPAEMAEQISAGPRLMLVVLEGEGAINNIRQRTAREPIVEVQDENHRPVAGALVLFALPRSGAGGTFPNGATSLRVTTDAQGRAVPRGLKPNNIAGQFQIAISASYGGLTASISVHQVNSMTQATSGGSSSSATAGTPANVAQVDPVGGEAGDSAGGASTGGATTGAAGANASGGAAGASAAGAGNASGAGGGAGGGTGGATGSAAGIGIGVGAKVAIIGGLTATAVGGGLAAAGVFSGGAEPAISR